MSLRFRLNYNLNNAFFLLDDKQAKLFFKFKQSGIDSKNIIKYEFYEKDYFKFYFFLKSLSELKSFSLIVVYNDLELEKGIKKLLNYFNLSDVRCFYYFDLSFDFLRIINKLDCLSWQNVYNKKSYIEIKKTCKSDISFSFFNKTIDLSNFKYGKFDLCYIDDVVEIYEFFNFKAKVPVFKIISKKKLTISIDIYKKFENVIYQKRTTNKLLINDLKNNKKFFLFGKITEIFFHDDFISFSKNLDCNVFYFSFSNVDKNFEVEEESLNFFQKRFPKFFSNNKRLNYLLNDYLIDKIFSGQLNSVFNIQKDFDFLINLNFEYNLVDSDEKINYFSNKNLFKKYQNLMFNFFGVFFNDNGVILNLNKKNILSDYTIIFKDKFISSHKSLLLQNEVKINNILYSNLNFLPFSEDEKIQIDF